MTTAPDLPLPVQPAPAAPAPAPPPRLALVPEQPGSGDEIALDEAMRRATPRLRRYAARRLGNEHEAEEVVQDALLRAYQHRHELATEDDLMAWLTVVTGRLVIDRLRVRGRSTPVAEIPPAARATRDTADIVVARDEARLALDALEAMPSRQASVLWAREVEGLSYDQIGSRFDMTEPSVRSLLHRARRTLRREYAARGGTFPAIGLVALAPWLHGLRVAGRLRHVARKGAGAAAVTATGLAIVTVAPFGPSGPTLDGTPHLDPGLGVRSTAVATHHGAHPVKPAKHHAAAARPVARTAPAGPAVTPVTSTRVPVAPQVCGRTYTINCHTHRAHPLYVGPNLPVPVLGVHRLGISTNKISCTAVPTTIVTYCDPRGGTQ